MVGNRVFSDFSFSSNDPYFKEVIPCIPRLISLIDRNPSSKTYGCFDRSYWLDKAIDFPSANIQYSALALAYVYKYNFDGSSYYQNKQLLSWIEASMIFWTKTQNSDGSFDEFYPNERGWGAPTGFTCYSMAMCLSLLKEDISNFCEKSVLKSLKKGVDFLNNYEGDKMLTNHHAITILAINAVVDLTGDKKLLVDMKNKIKIINDLHNKEGWSKEYDGPDLGYLTATISFLTKSQLFKYDKKLQEIINSSIEFVSYFAQADGGFGGVISSRNTVHVYPDGFEITKKENKISETLSKHFSSTLSLGNTALPIRMPDRYLGYRLVEFLETAISRHKIKSIQSANYLLPFQKENFTKIFRSSGHIVRKINQYYIIINLSKGGVLKVIDIDKKESVFIDAGVTVCGRSESYTSSWIDKDFELKILKDHYSVSGKLVKIISPYQFTSGMIVFRLIQLTLGRISLFAYYFKILIKKLFISGIKKSSFNFRREIRIKDECLVVEDYFSSNKRVDIKNIIIGGDLHYRYVPQSRYFLESEKSSKFLKLNKSDFSKIFNHSGLTYKRKFEL